MVLVFVLYALLASTFILSVGALQYTEPLFLIGFRMIIAGALLLGWQFFVDRHALIIAKKDWGIFFKVSLFHIYFAFILDFWSLQYLSALKANVIYATTPFVTAFLAFIILKERLRIAQIVGMLIGTLSIFPVCLVPNSKVCATENLFSFSWPELALLGAVVCSSYAWFIVKQLMERGYGLLVINGMAMLVGGILSLMTWVLKDSFFGFTPPVSDWSWFLIWIFALILVANILFYNLYGWLLKSYSLTFIALAGFLSPSFGVVYEWLFMGRRVTWHYAVSICLVALGLYIFYSGELKSYKGSLKRFVFKKGEET
ncbi:MAG: hypothetical protein UV38_C0001G0055 [candidate division TM6 bacterium GW2011_GWE2_42_60]|nr:MAG: hypothetical protein UV38_C0001G0055 [candidate division TM6 bacterium GW2011_GWE2_42_60]HBY05751.1 hypothetical protein [Candidatus Dependentiae bacterium]